MLFEQIEAHTPCEYLIKLAVDSWEYRDAYALRRAVFCREQGLFGDDDRDAIDDIASLIVAVSCIAGVPDQVVGTVRIHQTGPDTWWGSRLAVHPSFRRVGRIGAALIRLAVTTAHARGCRQFLAHVQNQNAAMFRRLHWNEIDELELHGRRHRFMQADLAHYPPLGGGATGFVVISRAAA